MMQDGSLFYNPPAMTYSEHAPAPRLAAIVERRHGLVSIDRIASAGGVTRRHLERRFLARIGISQTPKNSVADRLGWIAGCCSGQGGPATFREIWTVGASD